MLRHRGHRGGAEFTEPESSPAFPPCPRIGLSVKAVAKLRSLCSCPTPRWQKNRRTETDERGLALGFGVDANGEALPPRAPVVRWWLRPWRGGSEKLFRR